LKLKKTIIPFLTKLFSVGLVVAFLMPLGLKLIHTHEFHSAPNTCKNNKAHIHESKAHNHALDYFFQPLVRIVEDVIEEDVFFLFTEEKTGYYASFNSISFKRYRSRAPPVFL
jgi:hypothetical protein